MSLSDKQIDALLLEFAWGDKEVMRGHASIVEEQRKKFRKILADNAEPDQKPGDTLEDNVRYLLSRCPFTVRDHSGDRTGSRAEEDLVGSLSITFLKMEDLALKTQARGKA